ncbi:hypothetical protein DFH06DRAFT_1320546 [Mycena polygramma]|nr:hypothetical protein DFH06DRAFT_1320546 [Mycena polygramma]
MAQPASLPSWDVAPHTARVNMPYTLSERLVIALEDISKREVDEPYYRGETNVRPPTPDLDSDSSSDEETEGDPSSSPPSPPSSSASLPPSSSPPSSPARPSSPEPTPPWSPHVGGQHRYAPYPQVWRRYGFFVKNRITPLSLRPHLPLEIKPEPTAVSRAHLRRLGFRFFDWNLEATPWVDRMNLVGAVLLGYPTDVPRWETAIADATYAMGKARKGMHRTRLGGDALRDGIVYGDRGCVRPQNAQHTLETCVELALLRNNAGIQDVISFQNDAYRKYFPKMWERGQHTIEQVLDSDPNLHLPFDETRIHRPTAWTEVEYQFAAPDRLARKDYRDSLYGVRALTALGTYDTRFTDVGDIIFWGSKVFASFPVGSTFMFPAWWMPYSFTMVDRDETHYLVMQHMDAGIDRWVENGRASDRDFEENASNSQKKLKEENRVDRLNDIVGLFSSVDEV